MESIFGLSADIVFMKKALKQARLAFRKHEVPVGAVIVSSDGKVLARSHNKTEAMCSQAGHAEMVALSKAGKKLGGWQLVGCWVYVTLEPCAMCMHMMFLSRLAGVVFGAPSLLFGYQLDKANRFAVYKKDTVQIIQGVCALEAIDLLRTFFKKVRKGESNGSKKTGGAHQYYKN